MTMQTHHPDELLAWYVNGTLAGEELREVKQHLESCERCRQEIALLQKIRARIQADKPDVPGEFGLNRLMRDIRKQQATKPTHQRPWWQPALAAAAVIIVVQGVMLMNFLTQPAPITLLGEPAMNAVVLQVKFAPDTTEAQIRELLVKTRGVLIGGPGALGIYRVRLEGVTKAQTENVQRIISDLRAQDKVITYVERE